VSKTKSCAPLLVIAAAADPVPKTVSPDPFGAIAISILVSPPVADSVGSFPVAAFAIVNSFTAELVAVSLANSFPFVSKIEVPILGEVKVLFVKVCVPVSVTSPAGNSIISGFVPSLAEANTILVDAGPTVTESPDPETYLKTTFCDPLVEFFKK